MKKNIFTALLLLLSMTAMAQKEIDTSYRGYVQAHISGNRSASEELRYTKTMDALKWGADLGLGYHFNDYWGIYLGAEWNKNGAATHDTKNWKLGEHKYTFTSIEPNVAVTYNISNGILGFKPSRRNNFYLHFGPSIAIRNNINFDDESWFTEDKEDLNAHMYIGGKLGLNYVYSFNNWIAFTADLTGTMYGDKFSGRNDKTVNIDGRINLGVGLRIYLTKPTKPMRQTLYEDHIIVKHDTIRTREERRVYDPDIYPIFFATNASTIESQQAAIINTVAQKLANQPNRIVYVIGYADANSENKKDVNTLAKNRAENIALELINKYGIDPDRVVQHDMGNKVQPYTSNVEKNRSTICIVTDLKHQ